MSIPVKISGSRASTIMGINPWQSELEVWQNIMEETYPGFNESNNYELPEFKTNNSMIWGSSFETDLIIAVEKIRNIKIRDREKLFIKKGYISCHIDGIANNILIENKTTSEFYYRDNFGELPDKIPVNYQAQVQHNLYCTGLDKCLMPVLIFPKRPDDYENNGSNIINIDKQKWIEVLNEMGCLKFYEIPANKETQKAMLSYYKKWWSDHIKRKRPPEPAYYKDIKRIFKSPKGTIIADMQLERWTKEYKDIGVELGVKGPLKKRREQLKVLILKEMMKLDGDVDDDSREKTILRSKTGGKLMSYDGKVFR